MIEPRAAAVEPDPSERAVPRPVEETRAQLVDAATRVFAEQGIQSASLLEVTRLAGQRNRGAVHYHFGSREGILVAVIDRHSPFLARREAELLARARARPGDMAAALEAVVRPAVELAEDDWRGACFLRIAREVVDQDLDALDPDVRAAIERTGGAPVYEVIAERMAPMPETLRAERLALMTSFFLQSVADRATASERAAPGRARLPAEAFIANLVAMATGMLAAPVPPDLLDEVAPAGA